MKYKRFDSITIVGVGLLGGSLGLAIKAVQPSVKIVGVGHRQSSLDEALRIGAVDEVTLDPPTGVATADLVVLCTPVGLFAPLLKQITPVLKRGAVVTDVGSTKGKVVGDAERILAGRNAFVGSHPIAGSERRGVAFSRTDLFEGKTCILTPTKRTSPTALGRVERFWRAIGMRTTKLSPGDHDRALARVSHLPHALAALLVNVQNPKELDLSGSGFADSTRIAGGDPVMWRDICLDNRRALRQAVNALREQMDSFCDLLDVADGDGLADLFARAQKTRADLLEKRLRLRHVEG